MYEGEWVCNMKEGFAIFIEPSGEYLDAVFKSDRMERKLNRGRLGLIVNFVEQLARTGKVGQS